MFFNRHAFNDRTGLPSWFFDDETKHNKPNLPVTKDAIRVLRERMKALNARPIKKIAEAKARKKMRAVKRLAKLQKKTEAVAEGKDMTEREKAEVIAKMVNKTAKTNKRQVKVVVARGTNKGNKGRPKGVKGRYKVSGCVFRECSLLLYNVQSMNTTLPCFCSDGRCENEERSSCSEKSRETW